VIDAALHRGPVSTTIMADFGADVIRWSSNGDVYRVRGPGYLAPEQLSVILDNRTKRKRGHRSAHGGWQDLLHRLVTRRRRVRHQRAARLARALRVRYEDLPRSTPRLVYASDQRLRRDGEEASKPGFGRIALWARTD